MFNFAHVINPVYNVIKKFKILGFFCFAILFFIGWYNFSLYYENKKITSINRDADNYYYASQFENAASLYKKIANIDKTGHAQLMLGNLYMAGLGVPRSYSEALNFYNKALMRLHNTKQNGDVLFGIGLIYMIQNDNLNAFKYVERAAKFNNQYAQAMLAQFYENGTGTPSDYERAYIWASLALAQGITDKKIQKSLLDIKSRSLARIYIFNDKLKGIGQVDRLVQKYYRRYVLQEKALEEIDR